MVALDTNESRLTFIRVSVLMGALKSRDADADDLVYSANWLNCKKWGFEPAVNTTGIRQPRKNPEMSSA